MEIKRRNDGDYIQHGLIFLTLQHTGNMNFQTKYITPDIKLSSYENKLFKTEAMFDQHTLVWLISGETKIIQADKNYFFKTGDIFLIPRNHLATILIQSQNGLTHKAVAMHLSADKLRKFYADLDVKPKALTTQKIRSYNNHPLLESFLASLIPYFDLQDNFPEQIASLKITEAITILRTIDKSIDDTLANFEEPHKIDISGFMEKNFMFNMPLEKFGYLTGRSLTTFKRDFKKAFNTTPQRWLTQKRLELAYYQLTEKKRKPIEVFYETGFENLSHFSYVFKKRFGYAPADLAKEKARN